MRWRHGNSPIQKTRIQKSRSTALLLFFLDTKNNWKTFSRLLDTIPHWFEWLLWLLLHNEIKWLGYNTLKGIAGGVGAGSCHGVVHAGQRHFFLNVILLRTRVVIWNSWGGDGRRVLDNFRVTHTLDGRRRVEAVSSGAQLKNFASVQLVFFFPHTHTFQFKIWPAPRQS